MGVCENLVSTGMVKSVQDDIFKRVSDKLHRGEKLNVYFFVGQKQFWSMQSVYDSLKQHDNLNLSIVPFPASYHYNEEIRINYNELCEFHKSYGAHITEIYDFETGVTVSPDTLSADIIFYEQHWMNNYFEEYRIYEMFVSALCICVPYGIMTANIPEAQFNGFAHNLSWINFVESPLHFGMVKKYADNKGVNAVVSGYPKLDEFSRPAKKNYWKTSSPDIKRIIWAPHYSVNTGLDIDFSTFLEYRSFFLNFAKAHKNIEFILRPHPALKSQCLRIGMSENKFESYMSAWSSLPNASVVYDGNYIDLFKTSDALILDSISFISEYLLMEKPICFLNRFGTYEELAKHFNDYGKKVISFIDMAYDKNDISSFIEDVCTGKAVHVSEERKYFVENVIKVNFGQVGEYITSYIMKKLESA